MGLQLDGRVRGVMGSMGWMWRCRVLLELRGGSWARRAGVQPGHRQSREAVMATHLAGCVPRVEGHLGAAEALLSGRGHVGTLGAGAASLVPQWSEVLGMGGC